MFNRTPEPTKQENPVSNVIGGLNPSYLSFKHDLQTIKSVHMTCDNKFVLFAALRKIFFKEVEDFKKISVSAKQAHRTIKEKQVPYLGGKINTSGSTEVHQIECHPALPDVVASVSGNSLNVWDIQSPDTTTANFYNVNQIHCISWQHSENKLIATAASDTFVQIFDVKQRNAAHKLNLRSRTDHVVWNPKEEDMFATSHENELKFWDLRKVTESSPLKTITLNNQGQVSLNKIQFDPVYGKLLMTQDVSVIRLFSVDHGTELDYR